MKILFPSVYYLPQSVGGIELYIQSLAFGLSKKGYDVKVAIPVFSDDENRSYTYEGITILTYRGYLKKDKPSLSGLHPNESITNFKQLLQREKPDIVHFNQLTNSNGISLHHIEAARQMGAKIVYTNHLSDFICQRGDFMYMGTACCEGTITVKKCTTCLLNRDGYSKAIAGLLSGVDGIIVKVIGEQNYIRQLQPIVLPGFHTRWHIHKIRSIINIADAFVSIAEWMNKFIKQNDLHKSNCLTIKTGLLKTTEISLPGINKYDGKRQLKIIYVGRLMSLKGTHILIEAVKKISENLIEVNIYGPTTGEGVDKEYCNLCLESARNNPNIIFHDRVDNNEVINLMKTHDILCVPSRGEMAPLVIQEAMAAGIPVAGSDLPAIKEWVLDGYNGFIFPMDKPEVLMNKLLSIISNPPLLAKFKRNLPTPGNFNEMTDSYEKLYQSLFINN